MKTTLISSCCDNIGQMKFEHSKAEIERMNRQTKRKWRADMSDQMYCDDETDDDVLNPCPRIAGNCFVTCSNEVEEWND